MRIIPIKFLLLSIFFFSNQIHAAVNEDEAGRRAVLELRKLFENVRQKSSNLICDDKIKAPPEVSSKIGGGDVEARRAIIDLRKRLVNLQSKCGLAEKFVIDLNDWSLNLLPDVELRSAILDMRQKFEAFNESIRLEAEAKRRINNKTTDLTKVLPSSTFQSEMPSCVGNDARRWTNCQGVINFTNGDRYEGEFRDGKWNGWGTYYHLANNQFRGDKYTGQFLNGSRQGSGRYTAANSGETLEGIWSAGTFLRAEKVNLQAPTDFALLEERKQIEEEKKRLAEERRQMEEERKRRETAKANAKIDLRISTTKPDSNGIVVINVQTGTDTSSLKINGEEQGADERGTYQIKRLPKVGQDTVYSIVASDLYGNTKNASITLSARVITVAESVESLSPEKMKVSQSRDAVAIIIGIQDYKRLPKAEFASDDARAFYDYAVRALGVKPQNIKMLLDADAEQVEIYRAFRTWLPALVKKDKTDVYVFYSGHGLPSTDGKSLYLLPQGVDKEFLAETGVDQNKIISALNDSKPRSVTIFIDSCYSGSTRTGETLLASARPIALKAEEYTFPSNFTVISASSFDQISSSSKELKHGIFSFYLMKGLEGEASEKKDGKITVRELQNYLAEMVPKQAMRMNRKQQPQLIGDPDRVLVNK
jgi:hypothetical protein